jgi:hypothetical protein
MSAEIDAFVWHDLDGTIVAVGHVSPGQNRQVEPACKPHHRVLRVRMQKEHLNTLHLTHRVDLIAGVLRPRAESTDKPRPNKEKDTKG